MNVHLETVPADSVTVLDRANIIQPCAGVQLEIVTLRKHALGKVLTVQRTATNHKERIAVFALIATAAEAVFMTRHRTATVRPHRAQTTAA